MTAVDLWVSRWIRRLTDGSQHGQIADLVSVLGVRSGRRWATSIQADLNLVNYLGRSLHGRRLSMSDPVPASFHSVDEAREAEEIRRHSKVLGN